MEHLKRLEETRALLEKDEKEGKESKEFKSMDVHCVAELLKRSLRDWKDGLMNWEKFDPSLSFGKLGDKPARLQYMKDFVDSLPPLNQQVVASIVGLIHSVSQQHEQNHMDVLS